MQCQLGQFGGSQAGSYGQPQVQTGFIGAHDDLTAEDLSQGLPQQDVFAAVKLAQPLDMTAQGASVDKVS